MRIAKNNFRSNEPIFWGLFGAGGMVGAVCVPAVILIMCFLFPLHVISPEEAFSKLVAFSQNIVGQLFILAVIILPVWCGVHRIHHCLHDMKVHCLAAKWLCYSFALVISLLTVFVVFAL